jgi:hypothetical protein
MSDYEYWQEMKLLSSSRIEEIKRLITPTTTGSKLWWLEKLVRDNESWLRLAEFQIYNFEKYQNKMNERVAFKRATFRGNDDT